MMLKNLDRLRGINSLMCYFGLGVIGLGPSLSTPSFASDDWCLWDRIEKPCGGATGYCYRNPDETQGGFVATTARVDHMPGLFEQLVGSKPTISRNAEVCGEAVVLGDSSILGYSSVSGRAKVINSKVAAGFLISGDVQVLNGATVSGLGTLSQNEVIDGESGQSLIVSENRVLPLPDDLVASRLHAQTVFEKEWYGLRIDRESELQLKSSYRLIKSQLPFIQKVLPTDESGYQINLHQMILDPYRHLHNSDLNARYPEKVTDERMISLKELWLVAYQTIPSEVLTNVGYDQGPAAAETRSKDINHLFWTAKGYEKMTFAMKQQTHKRFLRLHDHFQKLQDENARVGELLPVSYLFLRLLPLALDRVCTDEIQHSLTVLEKEFLNDAIESVVHAGDFFSRIFTEEKQNYLQSYIRLVKADKHWVFEHRSEMLHRLNLLLHFPYALPGGPSGVSHLHWGAAGHMSVRPVQVFARLFTGGSVPLLTEEDLESGMPAESMTHKRKKLKTVDAAPELPKVNFAPLTIARMIQLLTEARQKGLATANGSGLLQSETSGLKLTNQMLTEFCMHDKEVSETSEGGSGVDSFSELSDLTEALYELHEEQFQNENANPVRFAELREKIGNNRYFAPAEKGQNAGNIMPKRAFWIHMLEKYGYIIHEKLDTFR